MIYLLEMVDLSIVFCKRLPEGSSIVVIMAVHHSKHVLKNPVVRRER